MNKPVLVIVTGSPASGKSTLSHLLSTELNYPLLSRDEMKEGYINTLGITHSDLSEKTAWHIYETFFMTINLLISRSISVIIEAAFQHKLWEPKIKSIMNHAEIKIIICKVPPDLARERFNTRRMSNPDREKYHGDRLQDLTGSGEDIFTYYEAIKMPIPTLEVETINQYNPGVATILEFIKGNTA